MCLALVCGKNSFSRLSCKFLFVDRVFWIELKILKSNSIWLIYTMDTIGSYIQTNWHQTLNSPSKFQ